MKLKEIATKMRAFADAHPYQYNNHPISAYQQPLSGGCLITHYQHKDRYYFSAAHRDMYPDAQEMRIFRRAFQIPTEATREIFDKQGWRIIRYHWPVNTAPTFQQLELFPTDPANPYELEP